MNFAEQIAAFEAKSFANAERMNAILAKSAEEGSTLDAAQSEEFDGLTADNEAISSHLGRLKAAEKAAGASAKPVEGKTQDQGTQSRVPATVKAAKPEAGIRFAQVAKSIGLAAKTHANPVEIAQVRYANDPTIANVVKAAVGAASTGNPSWAGALVGDEASVYADFVEFLRPQTIVGRFGQNGVPGLRRVPFRVPLVGQTSGGSAGWVGEGAAKPVTKFDYARRTLQPTKVAAIAVSTMEVLRDSSPSADALIRDSLASAVIERLDIDFINPAKAAVSDVSPASILNGVAPIASSGTDADAIRADLRALFGAFVDANNAPEAGVFVMQSVTALALSLMTNPLGQPEFANINMRGGTLNGFPVIVSQYVPAGVVALVNASDIYIADDGEVTVDFTTEGAIEMNDAPTGNSVTPTAAQLVSMFQTNSVAFRAERTISWARRRDSGVAYLTGVNWGVADNG